MAALERLQKSENDVYQYVPVTEDEWQKQRAFSSNGDILFSILVPVYCTPETYFREMIQSVLDQSYQNWELLLGDASPSEGLKFIIEEINDKRVKYIKINENKGISANTNVVLKEAAGQYIGLLDHDDVLTPDALYCVYEAVKDSEVKGICPKLIYSDEDKGDGEMKYFYDLNAKPSFDQDYLWSNNYICHFTVMEAELMKKLKFRSEFDGAQDFDIILRAVREIEKERKNHIANSQVVNISRVLYHWRCHMDSTAVNPQSKLYAYEAGKCAVEEDLQIRGIEADVYHSRHLGFYRVCFKDIFRDRPEVAMVAGPVYKRGRIWGGARDKTGRVLYSGLIKGFSGGHLHRAGVWQQCYAADFEHASFRENLFIEFLESQEWLVQKMFQGQFPEAVMKSSHTETFGFFNEIIKNLDKELQDSLCMAWANYVHGKAMVILYDPEME